MNNIIWYDMEAKKRNEVVKVEGLKHPDAGEGWDRKWVGIHYADGGCYMGIFDGGCDWLPDGNRVSSKIFEDERLQCFAEQGWTVKMTSEEIKSVAGVEVVLDV